MTILFYCQHSVGLGHLMRSYALCAALAERFRVVLLCGGPLPERDPAAARRAGRRAPAARRRRRGRLLSPRPALLARAGVGGARRADPLDVPRRPPRRGAGRAVPVRAREVRPRARAAAGGRPRRRRADRVQPARHPRQPPHEPARARRPRRPARGGAPRRRARARRPALRPARGDLRAPARRARPLHGLRRPRAGGAAPPRATTCWSRPAAGWSASRCCGPRPSSTRRCGSSAARCCPTPPGQRLARSARAWSCAGRARPRRRARRGARPRSARRATTPRSRSSRSGVPALLVPYATPEEDEQTRRARRLERLGAVQVATVERLADALPGLLEFTPPAGDRRPRRRAAHRRAGVTRCCATRRVA